MTDEIDAADYVAQMAGKKPSKYRAEPVEEDGIRFASKAERKRYRQLKLMVAAGKIADLELQPAFPLIVNGFKIGRYTGDFKYVDVESGQTVIEDVKSPSRSRDYVLRKKLLKALHGIEIQEVAA